MSASKLPSDAKERRLAVSERHRNLLVDAGAGTGKTSLVVDRLAEMVAPEDDGGAYPLERIAAITFTRRAAGELRLRIRERLLSSLGDNALSMLRRDRFRAALTSLDTAFIGTIHSFADRLLRLCPVEAELSPSYEIEENDEEVIQEAYLEMLQAAQAGMLGKRFTGTSLAERAVEAEETILAALEGQLRAQTQEYDGYAKVGLDWLTREFLRRRDCPPDEPPSPRFDDGAFRRAVTEYLALIRPLPREMKGERWLHRFGERLREVEASREPKTLFELVQRIDAAVKGDASLKDTLHFTKGPARDAWGAFREGLADALTSPIRRWMACRLLRVRPVAEAIYDAAKGRRRSADSVDLLLKLANLLRRDLPARAGYQKLFDHIFVDEFQDTDPLQAEIVIFLAERDATARNWKEVTIGDGRLTLVGDPKQSIYRFRRADVAMYEAIHAHVAKHPGSISISLRDNFRSVPGLVNWYNDRFNKVLGTSPDRILDGASGRVFYRPLTPFRTTGEGKAVHLLPFTQPAGAVGNAPELRALEGEALAQYMRWLVEESRIQITDPHTKDSRPIRYLDIAVLALVTTQLQSLFAACDSYSVPYTAGGGTLFLRDPVHRQFILGLRALSDADDGVAEAALLRPPFFSIDLWDVLQARAGDGADPEPVAAERGRAARDLVRALRRERFNRSPGSTARRLLDETSFGRLVALGPNGEQRVRQLRELCMVLDQRAAEGSLDFDRATDMARSWIDWPIQLDAPRPVWSDAIQVMSVHQAKGLEFPVVVLWDACGTWAAADRAPIFVVDPGRREWALRVQGLSWEEPAGSHLLERAQEQADSERLRVVYVAATRAREILVVSHARGTKFDKAEKYVHALLAEVGSNEVYTADAYARECLPKWVVPQSVEVPVHTATVLDEETRRAWMAASDAAKASRWRPAGVSAHAKAQVRLRASETEAEPPETKRREGRYGPLFGDTVHRAIGLTLVKKLAPIDAVTQAARMTGLSEHLTEAEADVARTLQALTQAGISAAPTIRLEYPVGAVESGRLLTGYVDLVAVVGDRAVVIDFKTDRAPEGIARDSHPEYVAQVDAYVQMLAAAGLVGSGDARGGLLWTETGMIEWL